MKSKELAEVAGLDVSTIRKTAKKLFPEKTIRGKEANYTEAESIKIMAMVGKKNFVERKNSLPERKNSVLDSKLVSEIVSETIKQLLPYMQPTTQVVAKPEQPQIPAKLEPKDEIRKIINSYTNHTGTQYRDNWNLLYQECYYRLGKNFRVLAQNRQVKPMEIVVSEGFAPDVLLVARDLFQLGRV